MKQETPKTETKDKKLSELSKEEMTSKLAEFQEALKSDTFKDIDQYKALGLERADKTIIERDMKTQVKNEEAIKRLLPIFDKTKVELIEAGYEFKSETKMSEGEIKIHEEVEKLSLAKFAEQKAEVLKIDPDYPVKEIEDLKIPTGDKVAVMTVNKTIAERNVEAIAKGKKEFDTLTSELKEVKLAAPADPKKDVTGESIVNETLAKFGMKVEEPKADIKSEKQKKE